MTTVIVKLDGTQVKAIDTAAVDSAISAQLFANRLLEHEELFNSTIQGFINLELRALSSALNHSVRFVTELDRHHDTISSFNLDLYTFLFASKGYIDKTRTWLSRSLGSDSDLLHLFDELRRAEHTTQFEYQFFEALRNYTQHVGAAVSGVTFGVSNTEQGIEYTCSPTVSRDALVIAEEFRKLRGALQAGPADYPVLPALRAYMSALGRVHSALRMKLDSRLTECRGAIFHVFIESDEVGDALFAVHLDETGREQRRTTILVTTLNRISALTRANPCNELSHIIVKSQT